MSDNDTYDNAGAICPYCGRVNKAEDSDGILYDEGTNTYDCGECGEEFNVAVYMDFSWRTRALEG